MSKIFAPNKQLKMTNVAIIRMSKGGKRFEIACYKNKVQEYRSGVEKNLEQVLQTPTVFYNVSKGLVAPNKDLEKIFTTENHLDVCKIIITKGELQVSEKERKAYNDSSFKEIALIVSDMCRNIETSIPYTLTKIENAMKEMKYVVHPKKSHKQQAKNVIKTISEMIPIQRPDMKIKITIPGKDAKKLKDKFITPIVIIEEETFHQVAVFIGSVPPGQYQGLAQKLSEQTKGKAKLEVLALVPHATPELTLESKAAPVVHHKKLATAADLSVEGLKIAE